MFEFEKGMICLMETGIGQKAPDEDKTAVLEQGTPVKIVDIVEPACAAMVSGECQAPCKGAYCPRSIIVEDCNGKRWTVNYDIEDGEYPLIALEGDDIEDLLQKKGWKQFKMTDWANGGFPSEEIGPVYFIGGVVIIIGTIVNDFPGVWDLVFKIVGCLIALYGAARFIVGNKCSEKPITFGEFYFYRSFEKNKEALEALMK